MTNEAYVRALHRIVQLLTGSSLSSDEDRKRGWRDWAAAIADEWDLSYDMRLQLWNEAHDNAVRYSELAEEM